MSDPRAPEDIGALLEAADRASPATRIDDRDLLANCGPAIVGPLLEWIRAGKHPQCVIRVFEVLAASAPVAAAGALRAVPSIDPSLQAT
jgi:hypothetical protein